MANSSAPILPLASPHGGGGFDNNGSLYVGDLDAAVTEPQLFDIFGRIAPVASVRVCRNLIGGVSLGYGYVNYHTAQDASRALEVLNFTPINGKPIRIMFSNRDPSTRKSGYANVFIKNLDQTIDNKALYDIFVTFGAILSCKVATDNNGRPKGYGFVQFQHEDAAETAIRSLNQMLINGKKVYVGFFHRRESGRDGASPKFTNVYVKNLSEKVTHDELINLFDKFGKITSAVIVKDASGNSRGFGFVNFENSEHAVAAIERLNGETFKEKVLYVGRAQKKAEREEELKAKFEQERNKRLEKFQGTNLYLKNLDDSFDDEKLRELFMEFGNLRSYKVMLDSHGHSRGFGFVAFSSPEEASRAVSEMNGKVIGKKPLYVALAQRKEERKARLQAHFAQRTPGAMTPTIPGAMTPTIPAMPGYHPGAPRLAPQVHYGQGAPGVIPPQPAGYGFQQQLIPGMRSGVAPNYLMPYHLQRQGQPWQRVGGHDQASQQIQQQQFIQRNANQRFRYPPNGRNGVDPSMMPQGMMGTMMPLPLDVSGMQAASMDATHSPAILTATLASALASAPHERRKLMLGEQLFPLVKQIEPDYVGKVTGMLLEMDQTEVLHLLESPDALKIKVGEAMEVLKIAHATGSDTADQFGSLSLNE